MTRIGLGENHPALRAPLLIRRRGARRAVQWYGHGMPPGNARKLTGGSADPQGNHRGLPLPKENKIK
jgi:hypothetical protein